MEAQEVAVAPLLERQGHELVSAFTEIESGRKTDRPQLSAALAKVRKRKAILCVAKLDRLARDVELIARLVKEAERNGFGGLLFADFPDVDATTPEGELFINQMAAFEQFEVRRISQRTKAGLAVAKSRGKVLGGVRAGQEASREASKAKANAEKLRGILNQFTVNTKSLRQIADDLESAWVKTPGGKNQWHPSQVARTMDRLGLER